MRKILVAVSILALATVACGVTQTLSTPTPQPRALPTAVADTPTPIVIVVTATPLPAMASPVPSPQIQCTPPPCRPGEVYYCPGSCPGACGTICATVTPAPATATRVPPTATAVPPTATKIPPTPVPPKPAASPTPPCQEIPVRGFGKVWAENESARDYVGCVSYPRTETGVDFTAQRFENGVIFYTNASGWFDKDAVLVLFRDNKTWVKVIAAADVQPAPIGAPPAGKFAPQGRIGYVWQQGAGVRSRLGWAVEPEKSGKAGTANGGAWQAFSRGYMYYLMYNPPDDRYIYVIATYNPYPPGGNRTDWLEFKDTWNP